MTLAAASPPEGTVRDWLTARRENDAVAIMFPETGEALSWRALHDAARGFAVALAAAGVGKGESFAIVAPNGKEAVIALYGALLGGCRATMINLAAGRDAIAYALEHSEARFAFVHPACRLMFAEANASGVEAFDLVEGRHADLPALSPEDHALLMYTSGTTGRPKGVVHTHASLLAGGWTTAIAHELVEQDRGFCVLPIYHINGLCVTVIGSLVSGGSLAMCSKFSASRFWSLASSSEATWFSVVPTIISHLLHGEAKPDEACRARMRFGRSASSALAVETHAAFEERFGMPIIETMGLTETAAQILSNPPPPAARKIGSPGIAFGCAVAINDEDGREVARGTDGEIVVRGPNVMSAYLKDPEATALTFRDGWLRTGDLGRMDDDGFVFVTGRLKELIIKGGENVAPREVDEALYAHPDVVEAAAYARPSERYGETIEAAVKVRDGSSVSEAELIEICKAKLGAFKTPDAIHFLAELPKGPSGKIQRMKLAAVVVAQAR